tara:strand:+ start:64 stop:330 length:267 start_codon:yes stop_codon:yes gene_type:complete
MSKEKKQSPNKSKDRGELDVNGNPIDPKKKYIGNKVKIPMASPNHPVYKTSATIIIGGRPVATEHKKKAEFLEFLNRAPISFGDSEEE